MKNELFIKNLEVLIKNAKEIKSTHVENMLTVGHSLFSIKDESLYTPEKIYSIIVNHERCPDHNQLNNIGFYFLNKKPLFDLFERKTLVDTDDAHVFIESLYNCFIIKPEKDEVIGIGTRLSPSRNALTISQDAHELLNYVSGSHNFEMMALKALNAFISNENEMKTLNNKHVEMILDNKSEFILNYLKESESNKIRNDYSLFFYNIFSKSRMFKVLCVTQYQPTLNIAIKDNQKETSFKIKFSDRNEKTSMKL